MGNEKEVPKEWPHTPPPFNSNNVPVDDDDSEDEEEDEVQIPDGAGNQMIGVFVYLPDHDIGPELSDDESESSNPEINFLNIPAHILLQLQQDFQQNLAPEEGEDELDLDPEVDWQSDFEEQGDEVQPSSALGQAEDDEGHEDF